MKARAKNPQILFVFEDFPELGMEREWQRTWLLDFEVIKRYLYSSFFKISSMFL